MRSLTPVTKPCIIFQALAQAVTKAFPDTSQGGKLPSPHQTCCMACALWSLKGVAVMWLRPFRPAMLFSCVCSWTGAFIPRSLYLRPWTESSFGASAGPSFLGEEGKTLDTFLHSDSVVPSTFILLALFPHSFPNPRAQSL